MVAPVGFLPLARPTFDVPFAEETAGAAMSALDMATPSRVDGDASLAMDTETARRRASQLAEAQPRAVVVFQATFADSTLIRAASEVLDSPIVLWAVPEERTGGRLRLNSLCGINLAAYVLAREKVDYRWVYRSADDPAAAAEISAALEDEPLRPAGDSDDPVAGLVPGQGLTLEGLTVGLVGDRPEGFEPCDYDPAVLQSLFGVSIDRVELEDLFTAAESGETGALAAVRSSLEEAMTGLDEVDQDSLERSLRIYLGLSDLVESRGWDGVTTRCWPECFTQFGGAVCAGNSMLTSRGIPGCCEADVYGDVTALLLQKTTGEPPLVADLVDMDRKTGTAVFWHCGLAPKEMSPKGHKPRATVHSNRLKPLLNEFPLRPGRITIMRLSQSQNRNRMLIGSGEMLDEQLPFSGTSGVARLDSDVDSALDTIMANGLEHHYGITYGDHRDDLRSYAASVGLEVIDL